MYREHRYGIMNSCRHSGNERINQYVALVFREYVYCVHFCVNPNVHVVHSNYK